MQNIEDELLPMRRVRARYNKTDRTNLRWQRDKVLPPPVWIGKRKYWRLSDLERLERESVGERRPITDG